jgi:hypothetical protein
LRTAYEPAEPGTLGGVDHPITLQDTGGLGPIRIVTPPGKLSVTPASVMAVRAVGEHAALLNGVGFDWGTGSGVLAIAAALAPGVDHVTGIELSPEDIGFARQNATLNAVGGKTTFMHADSFAPFDPQDVEVLATLRGRAEFGVANPPASQGDDGLGLRRRMLTDAREYLVAGSPVLVQISYQYSIERITRLTEDVPGYRYEGLAGTTEWVRFDQDRPDLSLQLHEYAAEEQRGGLAYTFGHPEGPDDMTVTATQALAEYQLTGRHPVSRWQMHRFTFLG